MSFLTKLNRLTSMFGGNRNFIPGQVLWVEEVTVAGAGTTSDPTTYTTTGSDITIPSHKVDQCSKILVMHAGSCRIDQATYTFSQWRIERTAPSTAEGGNIGLGTADANDVPEVYHNTHMFWVDDDLTKGSDHTYRAVFRNYGGNGIYAGNIYYKDGGTVMTCFGLA